MIVFMIVVACGVRWIDDRGRDGKIALFCVWAAQRARGFGFRPSESGVATCQLAALFARVERTISPASLSSLFRARTR